MFRLELEKRLQQNEKIIEAMNHGIDAKKLSELIDDAYVKTLPLLQRFDTLYLWHGKASKEDIIEILEGDVVSALADMKGSVKNNL